MRVWILIPLWSICLFIAACGSQENKTPPEPPSEILIQETEGPGIPIHPDRLTPPEDEPDTSP